VWIGTHHAGPPDRHIGLAFSVTARAILLRTAAAQDARAILCPPDQRRADRRVSPHADLEVLRAEPTRPSTGSFSWGALKFITH
jgi:hypothetical protein